ncbi:hypothetical protein ACFLFF_03095 [Brevibacillus reuszeri]|uniref:hypothetical protein n=1 Tax=Brevibacillus reuszeri TaxID=54915 RepID=UPI001BB42E14|nr:hypothetical protein [Brevibacillus reuszeri]
MEPIVPEEEGEQELVRLYILFGLLFRVAMVDLGQARIVQLKLSYNEVFDWLFQDLSRWAERQHHQLRRRLRQSGCAVVSTQRQGHMYVVQYRQRGYLREAMYSIEVLRAECQQLVGLWMKHYQQGDRTSL